MRYFVLLCLLFSSFQLTAQAVYKTVDEDGNITYTDQPPADDSTPMDMPKISVVKTDPIQTADPGSSSDNGPGVTVAYGPLKILEPEPDQSYWGTGGTMVVRVQANQRLANGHQVKYYFDGADAGTTSSMTQVFAQVERGEHSVKAEIVDANGKVLSSSPSVTFHMKQQSVQNRNHPANRRGD